MKISKKKGDTSLYVQIYSGLRDDILSGKIKPNEKLPSKRELAKKLSSSVNTVINAYAQLLSEGYIYAIEKKGYFATDIKEYSDIKINLEMPEPSEEEKEPEYFMDFKANRINLQNFPVSIWNKCMRKAILNGGEDMYKTVPYNGVRELRNAISAYLYRNRGISADPQRIIIGAGTDYIFRRLFELFGSGVQFAIEETGFKKLVDYCDIYHAKADILGTDKEGACSKALDKTRSRMIYVTPANRFPTGKVLPIKKRLEIFSWAYKEEGRYIIEDDYDSEFRYSGQLILPMYAEDKQDRVIYINTFSKTMVPSLRISYMILPEELHERYMQTQGFYSCSVSSFEQYALAEFINSGAFERHINRMRNYYRKLRLLILSTLKNSRLIEIAEIEEHNAGTHFLLKIKTSKTHKEIYNEGIKKGLHISFFSDYSIKNTDKKGEVTLVINYAAISLDKVDEVVKRLTEIFTDIPPCCSHEALQ